MPSPGWRGGRPQKPKRKRRWKKINPVARALADPRHRKRVVADKRAEERRRGPPVPGPDEE